jgi:hypothetical protein
MPLWAHLLTGVLLVYIAAIFLSAAPLNEGFVKGCFPLSALLGVWIIGHFKEEPHANELL